jgi:transcription elongation factor GreA
MTATLTRTDRHDALVARLADLQDERRRAQVEVVPGGVGDDADRATNVDGHVRLAMLEQRIAAVEAELADNAYATDRPADGTAAVGDTVTVDLGDGPEQYLLGSVDEAGAGLDVITPGSPLGKALIGTAAGTTVEYSPRPRLTLQATLVTID